MDVLELIPARFRNPAVARAMTSPSAIILTGIGAAVVVATGLPLVFAPIAGAAAYALRVGATAAGSVPKGEFIDPRALQTPWREFVKEAQQAKAQFDNTQDNTPDGPLKDRLGEIGERVGVGVLECWRVARQANSLTDALQRLAHENPQAQLGAIKRDIGDRKATGADTSTLERTKAAIEAQVSSFERMRDTAEDAKNRLRLLNAQLDEAVARAVELSVSRSDASALNPLAGDVDNLIGEMENLRQAIEMTGGQAHLGQ